MSESKDLLKKIIGEIEGKDPDDIKFADLAKRKKRTKAQIAADEALYDKSADMISNKEGLVITGVYTGEISWGDIKGGKKLVLEKQNLDEWGVLDFFFYIVKMWATKYREDLYHLRHGGGSLQVAALRDRLEDVIGFCSNLVLRDYIHHFFEHYADYWQRRGSFYVRNMNRDKYLAEFADMYDYRASFYQYLNTERKGETEGVTFTHKEILKSYETNSSTFLCNYGLVIAMNWLTMKRGRPLEEAVRYVIDGCLKLKARNLLHLVKNATEMHSPYPSFLTFRKPQTIMDKIDKRVKIHIEFQDNIANLNFLRTRVKNAQREKSE